MLNFVMPASLEDVDEANQVGVNVGMGVFNGVANPGLRRQVDDARRCELAEGFRHFLTVGDVLADFGKPVPGGQPRKSCLLEGDIVIVVDVIDANDLIAPVQKLVRHMGPDEPGCSRYQYPQLHSPC